LLTLDQQKPAEMLFFTTCVKSVTVQICSKYDEKDTNYPKKQQACLFNPNHARNFETILWAHYTQHNLI
jgi:hypothetical protein